MKKMHKTLEQTMKLLNEEWERSGETKQILEMDIGQVNRLYESVYRDAQERQKLLEQIEEETPFIEVLKELHECYIMLRVAVKLDKLIRKAMKKQVNFVKVGLDKEEQKLVQEVWKAQVL